MTWLVGGALAAGCAPPHASLPSPVAADAGARSCLIQADSAGAILNPKSQSNPRQASPVLFSGPACGAFNSNDNQKRPASGAAKQRRS